MRQVTNKDIIKNFLGESVNSPKVDPKSADTTGLGGKISVDLKYTLKEARTKRRAKTARERAKSNASLLEAYTSKRETSKETSATNAKAFVAEFLPSRHSERIENWSQVAPVWGDTWVSPLDENPSIAFDDVVKCNITYGARKLLKLWGKTHTGIVTDYLYEFSKELGMEDNSLHEFLYSIGFGSDKCKHSERGAKVLKLREFAGFTKALLEEDKYSPLKEIHSRAYSGYGHNSPRTGKMLFDYALFKERGFFAAPQAIDNMLWKVVDAFKRITGRKVSYEIALEAMGYSLVPRKAVIIMLANRAGIVTSSYQIARQAMVDLMPQLAILNLKLGDLLNRQVWAENVWEKQRISPKLCSVPLLALNKASKGKVVSFTGNRRDAIYWTKRMTHDDKCVIPGWMQPQLNWEHPALKGLQGKPSEVLTWVTGRKCVIDGVETVILRTFKSNGLIKHKAIWIESNRWISSGYVIVYPDGFTYHLGIASQKEWVENAHTKWLAAKPANELKREFEKLSEKACPLVTTDTSMKAGNCLVGTIAWLNEKGVQVKGIIGLDSIIHHLSDDEMRFKMVVVEALQRTKIDLGI